MGVLKMFALSVVAGRGAKYSAPGMGVICQDGSVNLVYLDEQKFNYEK